jgi:hypothetical protein
MKPLPNSTCPLCGAANGCEPAATGRFSGECWCTRVKIDETVLARIPEEDKGKACLCRACAGIDP